MLVGSGTAVSYQCHSMDEAVDMVAIYIDGIYYANRGVYVDDATTINCEYSLNEEVLSHYDPNFVKGL